MATRRRPKLFSFGRAAELANLELWITDPDEQKVCEAMIDAFVEVVRTRSLPLRLLEPIAKAAVHPSTEVRAFTITKLTVLAHYFDEACAVLGAVCQHPDEQVRLYAFAAMSNAPESAWPPLLADGLHDESWQVRKAAASVCTTGRSAVLATLVDAALRNETDARVRVVLESAHRFQHKVDPLADAE